MSRKSLTINGNTTSILKIDWTELKPSMNLVNIYDYVIKLAQPHQRLGLYSGSQGCTHLMCCCSLMTNARFNVSNAKIKVIKRRSRVLLPNGMRGNYSV